MASTGAQLLHHARRTHRPLRRRRHWLLAGLLVVLAGIGLLVQQTVFSGETQARPELQRLIEQPVTGASRIAPGSTAYVSGPHGTWAGAAGIADVKTGEAMRPDTRVRLESVSKIYTAALILKLDQLGKLRVTDTVEKWLPGLLPYGDVVTIRELLTMSSGIVDDNDLLGGDLRRASQHLRPYLARVQDAGLRARLETLAKRLAANPAIEFSPLLWVELASWQPLLFEPGTAYHYSNTNYDLLGLIAAKAGGQPLARLFDEQIFQPLGLTQTAYDPQGPIRGPHAQGYLRLDGKLIETTDWHSGKGGDGGIVSNAAETGRFLAALMDGTLLDADHVLRLQLGDLYGSFVPYPEDSGCAGDAYGWSGGGYGYKTNVWVNDDGSRVAVVLLNGRFGNGAERATARGSADATAQKTLQRLYCAA